MQILESPRPAPSAAERPKALSTKTAPISFFLFSEANKQGSIQEGKTNESKKASVFAKSSNAAAETDDKSDTAHNDEQPCRVEVKFG